MVKGTARSIWTRSGGAFVGGAGGVGTWGTEKWHCGRILKIEKLETKGVGFPVFRLNSPEIYGNF